MASELSSCSGTKMSKVTCALGVCCCCLDGIQLQSGRGIALIQNKYKDLFRIRILPSRYLS